MKFLANRASIRSPSAWSRTFSLLLTALLGTVLHGVCPGRPPMGTAPGDRSTSGTIPLGPHVLPRASIVTPNSIIGLTFDKNLKIASAKYDLEAAEHAFRQYELGYSQWNPVVANSQAERDWTRFPVDSSRRTSAQQTYSAEIGTQKDFFNGSSIFAGVGGRGYSGDGTDGTNPYLEGRVRFPLFSSFTTLERMTDRTFQQNELFNRRLDYVETVRGTIEDAQDNYFWLQVEMENCALTTQTLVDYRGIRALPRMKAKPDELRQLEDEIQSVRSIMTHYRGNLTSYLVLVRNGIGMNNLGLEQVPKIDLYAKDYYGKRYMDSTPRQLIEEALQNDAQIRVLQLAKENSELKKRLALKGKFDIFGSVFGEIDSPGTHDQADPYGYQVGAGISVRMIDPRYLNVSVKQADAEIKSYTAQIERRQQEVRNDIDRRWSKARSLRTQARELMANVKTRRAVYEQKAKAFAQGSETVENLILAQKNLLNTATDLTDVLGDFYEIVTILDEECGVYFKQLGISVEPVGKGD